MTTHHPNNKCRNAYYEKAKSLFGQLKLPDVPTLKIRESSTTKLLDIYDPIRRKWVALTPEEWVRQHFVAYLISNLGYSPHRIGNEITLKLNNTVRRADTVVYDEYLKPLVIVESKAPSIGLTNEVLQQALRYNLVFHAPAVMITNGIDVYTAHNGELYRGVIHFDNLSQ